LLRLTGGYGHKYGIDNVRTFQFNMPVLTDAKLSHFKEMVRRFS
jgi:hypothetical protein